MSRSPPINPIHQMASGLLIGDERLEASWRLFVSFLRTRVTSKDPEERWHSQTITELFRIFYSGFVFRRSMGIGLLEIELCNVSV